jgi:hypothetical protein
VHPIAVAQLTDKGFVKPVVHTAKGMSGTGLYTGWYDGKIITN